MLLTNLALFSVSKNIDISKIAICGGDQNIAILTLKTGPLNVFFTEKRYRSIIIGCISNNTSNTIPLRVSSISDLRCLTRKFAVR